MRNVFNKVVRVCENVCDNINIRCEVNYCLNYQINAATAFCASPLYTITWRPDLAKMCYDAFENIESRVYKCTKLCAYVV